ncbi:MAG: hypothetical protein HY730_01310 [Candidatus Tectomicrobia bacterium]|uniref:Lipoprotein n=1 Tax=Tectimicrobiota bacterium TaxID=2528274 RepID=A0A933GKU8_UNCTE|nr:hypothetical protein [Candidatus Tectomicrobia bacterium]
MIKNLSSLLILLTLAVFLFTIGMGCGKKGPPKLPPEKKDAASSYQQSFGKAGDLN